jgi:hypothetical protein
MEDMPGFEEPQEEPKPKKTTRRKKEEVKMEDMPGFEEPQEEPKPKKTTRRKKEEVKNVASMPFKVYGKVVQPGRTYAPSTADKKDEKATRRIENAIKKGYLERV